MALPFQIAPQSRFQLGSQDVTALLLNERQLIDNGQEQYTTLRPYQVEAVLRARAHFEQAGALQPLENGRVIPPCLIVAPTGSGKSGMATLFPYVLSSQKTFILTPSNTISDQLSADFGRANYQNSFFHSVGLTKTERHFEAYKEPPFVVSTVQSVRDMSNFNLVIANAQKFGGRSTTSLFGPNAASVIQHLLNFDCIIVDEAHHYPAATWTEIVRHFGRKRIIFLTATPRNRDGPILGENQHIVFEITRTQINTIREVRFQELNNNDRVINRMDMRGEDYEFFGGRIHNILDQHDNLTVQDPNQGHPVQHKAMVLVRTKGEAQLAAYAMGRVPHLATYLTGDQITQENLQNFETGDARILVVCGKLIEGYDNKRVSVCAILRKVGVRSHVLFAQFVGRCLRKSFPNDPIQAVVLSHTAFGQLDLWEQYDRVVADEFPADEEEDDV